MTRKLLSHKRFLSFRNDLAIQASFRNDLAIQVNFRNDLIIQASFRNVMLTRYNKVSWKKIWNGKEAFFEF